MYRERHENRAAGYYLTLMKQICITVGIITILFSCKHQLVIYKLENERYSQIDETEIHAKGLSIICQVMQMKMRNCQISRKRRKKFENNEDLVWSIHIS